METAEFRAKNRQIILMDFWRQNVDKILIDNEQSLLKDKGKISHKQMEEQVALIYDDFNQQRKQFEAKQADKEDLQELALLEMEVKKR